MKSNTVWPSAMALNWLCPWCSLRWPSTAFFSSTVLCTAAVYLHVGDPGWRPGLYLLPAGNPSHVSNIEWVFQVLMMHSKIVLCAKWRHNSCQISLHLDFSCYKSETEFEFYCHIYKLWSHVREDFLIMLNSLSCCCAATISACFWSVGF